MQGGDGENADTRCVDVEVDAENMSTDAGSVGPIKEEYMLRHPKVLQEGEHERSADDESHAQRCSF